MSPKRKAKPTAVTKPTDPKPAEEFIDPVNRPSKPGKAKTDKPHRE